MAGAGLLALAAGLVGCTPEQSTVEPRPVTSPAATIMPGETSAYTPKPEYGEHPNNPGVIPPGCEGTGASGIASAWNMDNDRVSGHIVRRTIDMGPLQHAAGEAVVDTDGVPVAYVVAEGDTPYAIAQRFCIGETTYLANLNSVRRNGVDQIYPGDTLNLNRFTITSVGDENGAVLQNDPRIHLPPQQ